MREAYPVPAWRQKIAVQDSWRIAIGALIRFSTNWFALRGETPGSHPISTLKRVRGLVKSERAFWQTS